MAAPIGLLPNLEKPEALRRAAEVARLLQRLGRTAWFEPDAAALLGLDVRPQPLESWAGRVEVSVVLGGDGTLLQAAKRLAPLGIAIVGINLGHLGFLTELEPEEVEADLPGLLTGTRVLDQRNMLRAEILRDGMVVQRFLALNDVVVSKGPFSRLIRVEVGLRGRPAFIWPADGIVLSTPTGSTAYALSAGGPVLSPDVRALSITPICPHSFYARTVAVDPAEEVRVRIVTPPTDAFVTVDGQHGAQLVPGDVVVTRLATEQTVLWRRPGWNFYDVLRRKLQEEEGAHAGE
ncbi:MAG: NAD(+)/NADH kinase [Thermaerobacter sp.]|nr:NAD(+)/NADH kinase [Thermaerobacter sp.]